MTTSTTLLRNGTQEVVHASRDGRICDHSPPTSHFPLYFPNQRLNIPGSVKSNDCSGSEKIGLILE